MAESILNNEMAELILNSEKEATLFLEAMQDIINKYGYVLVGDISDLLGAPGYYKQSLFGWKDLTSFSVAKLPSVIYGKKCLLSFPLPTQLEELK